MPLTEQVSLTNCLNFPKSATSQLGIIDFFRLHPFEELTINALMLKVEEHLNKFQKGITLSYGTFHRTINMLNQNNVIKLKDLGNYKMCSINLFNNLI